MTPLTDDELARYARHIVLREVGGAGQARIKAAHVAVIGAGGIGSPVIQYLAAAGVGQLTIIDDDAVDLSNLQRQTIFATEDTGRSKAQVAATRATAINPFVAADPIAIRITSANAETLLANADVIIDGCDNFATRLAVADAAQALRTPLVSAAIGQFEGQLAVYRGWEADKPCYRCLVGDAPAEGGDTCAETGVLGPVPGIIGSLAALETLRALTPFGDDPAGTLLVMDFLALRFRTVRLPKDPGCKGCGQRTS